MRFILLSLFIFINIWGSTTHAERGFDIVIKEKKRVALVIGNNNYQYTTNLHNAVKDANDIGKILSLKALGFSVSYLKNATQKEMDHSLEKFYKEIDKGGVALLYFAGHGIEFQNNNYLIPIDANLGKKSDAKYHAIPLNKIVDRMKTASSRLDIIILDACRNDPFGFDRAMGSGGLAKVKLPIGLFVAYATDAGQKSSDGKKGENGLFTKYLKYYIQQPLKIDDVFKKIRRRVYEDSELEPKQFPAIYNKVLYDDFYFTPKINNNTVIPHFKTQPANAKIDIKGIGIWSKGMSLKKGDYTLTVSSEGLSKVFKINISSNELFTFKLNPVHREDKKDQDIPNNPKKKISKLQQATEACNKNQAWACRDLAYMYNQGKFVPKDRDQAIVFYTKACHLNDGRACYDLGLIYDRKLKKSRANNHNKEDNSRLKEVCDYDTEGHYSCALVFYLIKPNFNLPKLVSGDEAAMPLVFDKACRLGVKEACSK